MKLLRRLLAILAVFSALALISGGAFAAEKKCSECHDDDDSVLAIGKTKHGTTADSRTPACVACHGPSTAHMANSSKNKPDRLFSKKSTTPVSERNEACMSCHDRDANRSHWSGSAHESHDVSCASCHNIHKGADPVRDKRTQAEVCFSCHKAQRAEVNKPSHHPIVEGKMACSDCHNVHGSAGPKLMKRDSVNDTCYTCHMEKRGPFARNHEPVDEDCATCHNPHGTVADSMLKMRAPFLCESCHTPHGTTPGLANPSNLAGGVSWANGAMVTQGRSCMNCHTQIHGSNNPGAMGPYLIR